MQLSNATDIRKNWSRTCDNVARIRPSFIKRTHDSYLLASLKDMLRMLEFCKFTAKVYHEKGSCTVALDDIDLAESAKTKDEAVTELAKSLLVYANEYYDDFQRYSNAPNRKAHLPFVMKALLLDDVCKIKEEIVCQAGKN